MRVRILVYMCKSRLATDLSGVVDNDVFHGAIVAAFWNILWIACEHWWQMVLKGKHTDSVHDIHSLKNLAKDNL
jgi:hypothetical protein